MSVRMLGAIFILCGCGWFGFAMASACRAEENNLRQLIRGLEWMEYELQFRQTSLPLLFGHGGNVLSGPLRGLFFQMQTRLEVGDFPDAGVCMEAVLREYRGLPENLRQRLYELGQLLGQFDLTGQVESLRSLRAQCEENRKELSSNRDTRLRSYETLGLCTGAALAVLLL